MLYDSHDELEPMLLSDLPSDSTPSKNRSLWICFSCGVLIMCLFLMVKQTSLEFLRIGIHRMLRRNRTDHIQQCVSLYNLLQDNLRMGKAQHSRWNNTLSLVGAYGYSDYSVVTIEADSWYGKKAYCRYFDENWMELLPAVESIGFPEFTIYCCKHPLAKYMSVSKTRSEAVSVALRVLDREMDDPKYFFSLCLAPIYGNESKWLLLAELVEHYKLQGVEHFYIYIKDIDSYSRRLADDYVRTGEAEVIFFREFQDRAGSEWQHVGIQDCTHRSLHHSRYSIFADLDERIVTTENFRFADIANMFTQQTSIALLCFPFKYVLRTSRPPSIYKGDDTLQKHMPILVFRNTSTASPPGCAPKCVVDPRRVLAMGIHNAYIFKPGHKTVHVTADKAVNMHYRQFYLDEWDERRLARVRTYGPFKIEGYPSHLIDPLYRNVKKRLDRVYGSIASSSIL